MLLWLTEYLQSYESAFRLFGYLTFRAILGALTALVVSLVIGPPMIRRLSKYQIGQHVRQDGPVTHLSKAGTPTMGGTLIIVTVALSTLFWSDLGNRYVWIVLGVMLAFGGIGWVDDYRKLVLKDSKGLHAGPKYLLQSLVGLTAALALWWGADVPEATQLIVPFFKEVVIPMGGWFILLTYFVIVGSSNAVNLTDGLDGLAIMPCVLIAVALGVFAYAAGNVVFAEYLQIPHIPGAGELAIFCGALGGAGLGFLWFNTYPAQVFMGDVGALALGAALGVLAVIVRQELAYLIMAGVFVVETVSVILQVTSYRLTGRRIFRMAPLHHHFELKGWPEPRVIVRFWIITVMLILVGLATLKIR